MLHRPLLILLVLPTLLITSALAASRKPVPPGGFKSCKAARAAGYSNMKRGEPGYSPRLDRDGDGIACDK